MVDRNAKSFILLSRSGIKGTEAIELVADMMKRNVRIVAPACDISIEGEISSVLQDSLDLLPSVKGCIQASMVLKVIRSLSPNYRFP